MSTDPDTILLESEDSMSKALDYLKKELTGFRTGRASPSIVEYVKVDYYGTATDLKALAALSGIDERRLREYRQGARIPRRESRRSASSLPSVWQPGQ